MGYKGVIGDRGDSRVMGDKKDGGVKRDRGFKGYKGDSRVETDKGKRRQGVMGDRGDKGDRRQGRCGKQGVIGIWLACGAPHPAYMKNQLKCLTHSLSLVITSRQLKRNKTLTAR